MKTKEYTSKLLKVLICIIIGSLSIQNENTVINLGRSFSISEFFGYIFIFIFLSVYILKKKNLIMERTNLYLFIFIGSIIVSNISRPKITEIPYPYIADGFLNSYNFRCWTMFFYITLNIFLYIGLNIHLKKMQIEKLEKIYKYYSYGMIFSLFLGIIFYFLNILGFKLPLIQSNDLSYSRYRMFALMFEPQYIAIFLILFVYVYRSLEKNNLKKRIIVSFVYLGIILTFSTTSYLILMVLIAIEIFNGKRKWLKFLLIIVILLIVLYGTLIFTTHVAKIQNFLEYKDARGYSIGLQIELIKKRVLTGIGMGNLGFYFSFRNENKFFNGSNIILRIFSETGLIGIIPFVLSFYYYTKSILIKTKNNSRLMCYPLIGLLIYFMGNTTMLTFGSIWVYLALVKNFTRLLKNNERDLDNEKNTFIKF